MISSLAFHYLADFDAICKKINHTLKPDGTFVFSVEHPVFTACGTQDWYTNDAGEILHWPVDRYFIEGKRVSHFLGEDVTKYHKTLTTYLNSLLKNGFDITSIVEPEPAPELLATIPEMQDELRRPMMLLVSARKNKTTKKSHSKTKRLLSDFFGNYKIGVKRLANCSFNFGLTNVASSLQGCLNNYFQDLQCNLLSFYQELVTLHK